MRDPELYRPYPRREVLGLFEGESPRLSCDGQIAIAQSTVTWLSEPPEGSFPAPSRFSWEASQRYEEATDEWWFLPAEVRDRLRGSAIHLFFDPESCDRFVYVGAAQLTSYGFTDRKSLGEASLVLERKLPREVWVWLGGYEGWSVAIDGSERRGLDDEEAIHLARDVLSRGHGEVVVTRYEEDVVVLLVEPRRAMLTHLAFPGDSGRTARDPDVARSSETAEFTLSNGQVDEYEYELTVSHSDARRLVEKFLTAGDLPWDSWLE